MMKLSVGLVLGLAVAALPFTHVSVAHADVCGNVGGPAVEVNGCAAAGVGCRGQRDRRRCGRRVAATRRRPTTVLLTAAGVPYYTPGNEPCY